MTLETWADKTRQAIQDEQSAKLRTELEQLRGEVVALRKALEFIRGRAAILPERMGEIIYDYAADSLASSPLSEKVAAVVRLSTKLREAMTATEASSGMSDWSLVDRENCLFEEWKTAVDALSEVSK